MVVRLHESMVSPQATLTLGSTRFDKASSVHLAVPMIGTKGSGLRQVTT